MMDESMWMPAVRATWAQRCASDGLKPGTKRRALAAEQYLQGALAVAVAAGLMAPERANMIRFLVSCGRIEDFLAEQKP